MARKTRTLTSTLRLQRIPTNTRVFELGLSTRTLHRVTRYHARRTRLDPRDTLEQMTVAELISYTAEDLCGEHGMGDRCLREVEVQLALLGLALTGAVR